MSGPTAWPAPVVLRKYDIIIKKEDSAMSWFSKACSSSVGKKYIMAASGMLLGGFLLVHAAGNTSIFWGKHAFNSYAEHLHSLGFPINIAELILLAIFLVHVVTGLSLFFQNRAARGNERYAVQTSAGGRTWGSRTMPYTGLIILAFILLHLINFHFVSHDRPISDIVRPVLHNPVYTLLYGVAMLALGLHLSHGFWSIFQSLGLNHPKYNRLFRVLGWAGCILIAGVFIAIVLLLLFSAGQLA
jgi:succinate dehydrogenase / fumarate reductase cytochrome b subunit